MPQGTLQRRVPCQLVVERDTYLRSGNTYGPADRAPLFQQCALRCAVRGWSSDQRRRREPAAYVATVLAARRGLSERADPGRGALSSLRAIQGPSFQTIGPRS